MRLKEERFLRRTVSRLAIAFNQDRQDLAEAGLWKTFQKLDGVLKSLGWEAAEKLEEELLFPEGDSYNYIRKKRAAKRKPVKIVKVKL